MKKTLALALAMMMIVATMGVALAAATQSTTPTGTITITNLNEGDEVNFYQVIGWFTETIGTNTTAGWQVMNSFPANNVKEWYATSLTQDKVTTIANALSTSTPVADTKMVQSGATSVTSAALPVGMYLVIVKTATDNVYNPMLLSVNFNDSDNSQAVNLSSDAYATYINGGAAKKQPTTLDKEWDDIASFTADENNNSNGDEATGVYVGAVVPFHVTVTVPNYSNAYTSPTFEITDKMTSGLKLDTTSIKVYVGDENSTDLLDDQYFDIVNSSASGYKIDIADNYLWLVKSEQKITIKYEAEVTTNAIYNVNRENNTVELKYSNNASDTTSYDTTSDETNHYTFSLDADIYGTDSGKSHTSELIKTGLDDNGNPVYHWNNLTSDEWSRQNPLEGAIFTLTGTRDGASWTSEYRSDAEGKIKITGLDEGTYTLQETSAPGGYQKDPNEHTIVISATYVDETNGSGKTIKKLQSYQVTIDGNVTRYTVKNEGQNIVKTSEVIVNETTNIVNTKGLELPSTGGIGTTIFYVAGLLMVLGAGTVLVARRKADAE